VSEPSRRALKTHSLTTRAYACIAAVRGVFSGAAPKSAARERRPIPTAMTPRRVVTAVGL
jgi:hypothetical protein